MRGVVEAKALSSAIKSVQSLVARAQTIPILGCVRIAATDGGLLVEATNLAQRARVSVAGGVEGVTIVNPEQLLLTLAAIRGEATFSLDGETLSVTGKGGRAKILSRPNEDWPAWKDDTGRSMDIGVAGFLSGLAAVMPAVADDKSSFFLAGINLRWRDVGLFAEACDRHRLLGTTIVDARQPDWWPAQSVIIPTEFVRVAQKALPDAQGHLSVTDSVICLRTAGAVVVSKLIDATYPETDRALPRDPKPFLRVDRESFVAAVDLARKFCRADNDGHRRAVIAENAITVEGSAGETFRSEFEGEQIANRAVALNADYIATALAALTGETVTLKDDGTGSPVMFDGEGLERVVVMPMRAPQWAAEKEAA